MNVNQGHVELVAEDSLDHLGLTLAEHAVVHEDAGELVADGAVHKCGDHGRVDTTGEGENDLPVPHLLANLPDLLVDDVLHGPGLLEATDLEEEVLEHLVTVGGMAHLGVELRGVEVAARVLHGRNGAGVGAGGDGEALGHLAHGVAVAHPHGLEVRGLGQDAAVTVTGETSGAVLALLGVSDGAAELDGHDLLAVAEAEDGDAEREDLLVHVGRIVGVDRGGTAREDDRRGRHGGELVGGDVTGNDF